MLALDHRGSFKKYVNKKNPEAAGDKEVVDVKALIIKACGSAMSGFLIDPVWGLLAYKESKVKKPFLLCLEKTGYMETKGARLTKLQYTGKQLKKWGASGAKILLYFNPAEKNAAAKQLSVAKKALADAHKNNLPLFLEIVTYGNEELKKTRAEWVLKSLQAFKKAKINPDVFKLEYPASAPSFAKAMEDKKATAGKPGGLEACKKITKLLGRTPWIILTRGETFNVFKKQLKDAIAAGAVGFLAGRAVWQEIADCRTTAARQKFAKIITKRFQELACLARLGSASARRTLGSSGPG